MYLMCASDGSGCLFWAQQGRGIYCVPQRTGVFILCLLGHRVSNMCLTWQRVCIVCPTWQGYLFCASHDGGVYFVPPGSNLHVSYRTYLFSMLTLHIYIYICIYIKHSINLYASNRSVCNYYGNSK